MPFIVSRVNTTMDNSQKDKIKDSYIEMLGRLLGKSESFVMLDLEDQCPLFVRGDKAALSAYIEINLYGKSDSSSLSKLGSEITDLYKNTLSIPSENVFINFREVTDFSVDGKFY